MSVCLTDVHMYPMMTKCSFVARADFPSLAALSRDGRGTIAVAKLMGAVCTTLLLLTNAALIRSHLFPLCVSATDPSSKFS